MTANRVVPVSLFQAGDTNGRAATPPSDHDQPARPGSQ